jgi:hypothetical protein
MPENSLRITIGERQNVGRLFYVAKNPNGYFIFEGTPEAVFERTKQDPTLSARLDRTPFATRAEAESRCAALLEAEQKRDSPLKLEARPLY